MLGESFRDTDSSDISEGISLTLERFPLKLDNFPSLPNKTTGKESLTGVLIIDYSIQNLKHTDTTRVQPALFILQKTSETSASIFLGQADISDSKGLQNLNSRP